MKRIVLLSACVLFADAISGLAQNGLDASRQFGGNLPVNPVLPPAPFGFVLQNGDAAGGPPAVISPVPEPSTTVLSLLAGGGLVVARFAGWRHRLRPVKG